MRKRLQKLFTMFLYGNRLVPGSRLKGQNATGTARALPTPLTMVGEMTMCSSGVLGHRSERETSGACDRQEPERREAPEGQDVS